ncbi:MAG: cell wall hydrolase [Pseudomonadota bacterium]|nr:cell wall hydrolase [Pseudomonadota bacterium]
MVISFRSAMLVCAVVSASSVAPAKVGPAAQPLLPLASSVSPSVLARELLRVSDQLSAPALEEQVKAEEVVEAAVDPKADLATMVAELRSSDPGDRQLECLAAGVYFESKSEPLAGQLAVGDVIVNRANSSRFPSTYCGVLFQRGQFSFVRGKSWPHVARSSRQWKTAVAVAKIAHRNLKDSAVSNALFFHAKRVSPGWRLKRLASVGNHIFYR